MNKDSFGDRMKDYEERFERYLVRRVPVILRLDGKSFHRWTKGLFRPFDADLRTCMIWATYHLCSEIAGARYAYIQSDEISILIIDYQGEKSEAWFDYRLNKIESVSASICTAAFNEAASKYIGNQVKKRGFATFDARAWNLPEEEVSNYFLWRQRDCERNSISMVAQDNFSHKELKGKTGSEKQDMLMIQKGINWNNTPTPFKSGSSVFKVQKEDTLRKKLVTDINMPIITKDRDYVERWLKPEVTYPEFDEKNQFIIEEASRL